MLKVLLTLIGGVGHEADLSGEDMLIIFENQVDAFADIDSYRNFCALVQQLQPLGLFGRDVDGCGNLLS